MSKPLIEVCGKPVINYIVEQLQDIKDIDEIYVSTNKKFEQQFEEWLRKYRFKKTKIVIENTNHEGEKLGAVGGLNFTIKNSNINSECLIIAGDNLFDFRINDLIDEYNKRKHPVLAVFDIQDKEKARLYGNVEVDENMRIINFVEKPPEPKSALIATCCFIIPSASLVERYIEEGNNKDSPGFFNQWLYRQMPYFAFAFKGKWYDIGDFDSLEKARGFG
ncbi:MAG: nucleotidyltransferase family protein [Candidatus Aenigmarchaeota archaeon]|nr:nucleotidyltransferase family protein [Candidatus Aenigmarchaeota archaeon]MDI6722661.1 nucleotidyltransferase family protein [Candidatus Aenigmarchaeota archaeon]